MSQFGLKTGDLLLYDSNGKGIIRYFDGLIRYFSGGPYTHISMVLKDPDFIHPSLKGYYVWESGWDGTPDPQDGLIKLGVQITPFEEVYNKVKADNGKLYMRSINCDPSIFNKANLEKIHDVVYRKPYDLVPKDWIDAALKKDDQPQKIDRFWCSALVGYIYAQCGIIDPKTDWSILTPTDFSSKHEDIKLLDGITLSKPDKRIF